MQAQDNIIIVSAGMLSPKKRDHVLARRQLYLNYGALTLATALKGKGYSVALVHGGHNAPESFANGLLEEELLPTTYPILLSLPSFFAMTWAQRFCRHLKVLFPRLKIVAGGRWVVGADPSWLRTKVPELDLVVSGLGDALIADVIYPSRWPIFRQKESTAAALVDVMTLPPFHLDHRIVKDFKAFQPSIEVSRGCAKGCAFCEERAAPLSKLLPADVLAQYMVDTIRQYGGKDIRPYLQSSFFVPNRRWAADLEREVKRRDCMINWRCETRVDCMTAETIGHLANAGLRVIDLGLETASPQQLVRMKKTQKPDQYLRKASEVLKNCAIHGIWCVFRTNVTDVSGRT